MAISVKYKSSAGRGAALSVASPTVGGTSNSQQNNGGVLGGIGYVGEKLAVGFMQSVEGIWDYSAAGIAKLFGQDEWAEEQIENDWFGDWYSHPDEWYAPSEGMKVAGDVAQGIGTSLPSIVLSAIPYAGPALAISSAALGAAGNATKEAYRESGKLGAAEFGYGALSGATEGLIEFATMGIGKGTGKIIKSISKRVAGEGAEAVAKTGVKTGLKTLGKNLAEDFATEAFEEGFSEWISPYYKRMTYDENAENASAQDILYSALIGGLSGMVMSGTQYGLGRGEALITGSKIAKNGKTQGVMELGKLLIEYEAQYKTGDEVFKGVGDIYNELTASLTETGGVVTTAKQKMLLADLRSASTGAVYSAAIRNNAKSIAENAQAYAERMNSYYTGADGKPMNITAEQLRAGLVFDKNGRVSRKSFGKALKSNELLCSLAVSLTAGQLMIDTDRYTAAVLSGKQYTTDSDLVRIVEKSSEAEYNAISQTFGIEDLAHTDADTLNAKIREMDASGELAGAVEGYKAIKAAEAVSAESAGAKVPLSVKPNRKDGAVRYHDPSGDVAIIKDGDYFRLYLYNERVISEPMKANEINKILKKFRGDNVAAQEAAGIQAEADTKTYTKTESKETARAREAKEIDALLREQVKDYASLSDGNKGMIRKLVRDARKHGIPESDILTYARVSAHSGIRIVFDKKACYNAESGKYTPGHYDLDTDRTVINPDKALSTDKILSHEGFHNMVAHVGGAKKWKALLKIVKKNMSESERQEIKDTYKKLYGVEEGDILNEEYVGNYAQQHVNKGFMEFLLAEKPSLKERILGFFKSAITDYKSDERLSRSARKFYRAYKKMFDSFAEQNRNNAASEEIWTRKQTDEGKRWATGKSFSEQIDDVIEGVHNPRYDLYVSETPKELMGVNMPKGPLLMRNGKIKEILEKHPEISEELLKKIPEAISDPILIIKSKTHPTESVVVITDIMTSKGEMIVPVWVAQEGNYLDVELGDLALDTNFVASAYGRKVKALIETAISDNGVFYQNPDEKRVKNLLARNGLQLSTPLKISNSTIIIPDSAEKVKALDEKYLEAVEKGDSKAAQDMVEQAARAAGYDRRMFHETDAENIHIFDISRGDHGGTDSETPYGIFTKTSDKSIGLGSRQMALFVKAKKTLDVENREGVKNKIPDLVPYYDEISKIDTMYDALINKLEDAEFDALGEWMDAHPDADMDEIFPSSYIIEGKAADIDYPKYHEAHDEYIRIRKEWESKYNDVAIKCKEIITEYLRKNKYDSMYFRVDGGSRGRQTDSLILLDPEQVKSADPVTYDDNGEVIPLSQRFDSNKRDIRYALPEGVEISKITADMSDSERYEALKDRSISLSAKVNNDTLAAVQKKLDFDESSVEYSKYGDRVRLFKKIGTEFKVYKRYNNGDIKLDFAFSKEKMRESVSKQRKNYITLAKMLTCFDEVIDNAIGIEVHNRNSEGYKPDDTLENMYVLASAFVDGNDIIPVKLEVKEFSDKENTLHVAIALESIQKDEIVKQEDASKGGARQYSPSSTISIAEYFRKINPSDESFYKYIPKPFLEGKEIRHALPEGVDTDNIESIGKDGKFGPFEPPFTGTISSVTTEKKDVYKRGVREAANDMALATQVAFTNEQAGVEWYLRQAGMSEREAQIITQIARAAGGMGSNAAMVAQYDFADFVKPGEKGEDGKYKLPKAQGRGILQIFNELEDLISKQYGLGKMVARERFYDYLLNLHNISRMSLNEASVQERAEIEDRLSAAKKIVTKFKRELSPINKQLEVAKAQRTLMLDTLARQKKAAKSLGKDSTEGTAEILKSIKRIEAEIKELNAKAEPIKAKIKGASTEVDKIQTEYDSFVVEQNKPVFGKNEDRGRDHDITADESKEIVAFYEKTYPEFKEFGKQVHQFYRNNLKQQVWGGMIKQSDYDFFVKRYPYYIPTDRTVQYPSIAAVKGKNSVEVKTVIRKASGGGFDIAPLLENATEKTVQLYRIIGANYMANAIYEAAQRVGDTKEVQVLEKEKVKHFDPDATPDKPKQNQVTFYRNGEKITMQVTGEIFAGFKAMNDTTQYNDVFRKSLRSGMNLFKSLVTDKNPLFLVSNKIKDTFDALFNTRHLGRFLKNAVTLRGARSILSNSELWQLNLATGGMSSSIYNSDIGYTAYVGKSGMKKTHINSKDGAITKAYKRTLGRFFTALSNANAVVEQGTRMLEFQAAIESGASVFEAMLDAAEVTTNFGRKGAVAKHFNALLSPFLNAQIQGASRIYRNFKGAWKDGIKGMARLLFMAALFGITPQLLNQFMLGDDDEYKELRDSDKQNYFIFKLGDGEFIKIPKGRVMSAFAGAVVQATNSLQGESVDLKEYGKSLISSLTPADSVSRTILAPIMHDLPTNTSWNGSAIEGQQFENTRPGERYDESTSSIAIAIGQAINYSPKKIHYLIDQYTGVIGDVILPLTTLGSEKGIVKNRFTVDSVTSNKLSTEFYKIYDDAQYNRTDYANGKITDDSSVYQVMYLNRIKDEVSKLYDQKRKIQASTELSDYDKIQQTRAVQLLINEVYRKSLNDYELMTTAIKSTEALGYDSGDAGEKRMRYTEAVRIVYGSERALSEYNSTVYAKMQTLNKGGIGYDTLYSYYFATKDLESDFDKSGKAISGSKRKKVVSVIGSLNVSVEQKLIMLCAQGYSIQDGDIRGMTKANAERRLLRYILSLKVSQSEKAELAKTCGFTVKGNKISLK